MIATTQLRIKTLCCQESQDICQLHQQKQVCVINPNFFVPKYENSYGQYLLVSTSGCGVPSGLEALECVRAVCAEVYPQCVGQRGDCRWYVRSTELADQRRRLVKSIPKHNTHHSSKYLMLHKVTHCFLFVSCQTLVGEYVDESVLLS